MEMRESVWRVGPPSAQVNPGQFFIRRGGGGGDVKISPELSINTDYMHVDAVKESGRKEEEKSKV